MMRTPEEMAEEWANNRCPVQGPEFIVWCMCKEDFLAGYKAAQQWISVKDRLPEEHVWVLGYYFRYKHEEAFVVGLVQRYVHSWAGANIWITDIADGALSYEEVQSITHWMPLPEPPKEEK